jgi:hypothetical protein
MRRFLVLPALTLALATLPARADDAKKSDLDPKALDILKQAAAIHKDAKSMHVEALILSDQESDKGKRQVKTEAVYDMAKPNHFALKTKMDGKPQLGLDLICDGKKVFVIAKGPNQYSEAAGFTSLAEVGPELQRLRLPRTGILFQNVLTADPYESLMEGVTGASIAGTEKVDGTEAHHLKFEQPGLNWELWVASTGKPVVLKARSVLEGGEGKITVVETYKNWKIDAAPAKDAFTFSPDAESKKVDEIEPGE